MQILLNGEPVTTKELTKLPPKQIQRVEFSDVPSALYPDAAGVLNVVLKRPETGGDFHGETIQPLMVKRSWIRSGVTLYFPHQMLQIGGFSQYSNYSGQIEFGESEYRFPTGTVTRKVNPIPARYQAWDLHAELWYRWYNEKSLLSLYANIGPFDRYHDDWAGEGDTYPAGGTCRYSTLSPFPQSQELPARFRWLFPHQGGGGGRDFC